MLQIKKVELVARNCFLNMIKLPVLFFDRKSMTDGFHDKIENCISQKVIVSFVSIERREV